MPSFPLIDELPLVLDPTGWRWELFATPSFPSQSFWIGLDQDGNKWLTKLRGGFYAYREIVFARLAQKMGWSCQSSVFLRIDRNSAKKLGVNANEVHAAHWFLREHAHTQCSAQCQLSFLKDKSIETVDDLSGAEISHLLDWPKSDFAACLFGANEPSGHLFTIDHEFVIIDSEQMFSTDPCAFDCTGWWRRPDGCQSIPGKELALEVCRNFCDLSLADIEGAIAIPEGISVQQTWPIAARLKASRRFAMEFFASR